MERTLFIFRRDLRLEDNTALLYALKNSKEVILSFIFTPEQIKNNSFRSDHSLQFMLESLEDLEKDIALKQGRLYYFFGTPEDVVKNCIQNLHLDGVVVNRDYTPYSIERDRKILEVCEKLQVKFCAFDDAVLHPLHQTLKSDGKPYTVFTPFYRNALKLNVPLPLSNPYKNYYINPISFAKDATFFTQILEKRGKQSLGGRAEGLKILQKIKTFADYKETRDIPSIEGTTRLSPHLKFTTVSVREVYHAVANLFSPDSDLIRSLFWRDFFTSIALYFPQVFQGAFKTKFKEIEWVRDEDKFKLWCEGKTGFPIVDAGMREMNQTGFMHNRLRMIVASFLIKDLHIDWRWGEKYFAQTLIDYDPVVNNGNWQWVASTGCDAQPYFRIFNPWTQSLKYDPDCVYIKRFVPELSQLPPKIIHHWYKEVYHNLCPGYQLPMVDHSVESKKAYEMYKVCL